MPDVALVDQDHLPARLDPTNPGNVPFCERQGFATVAACRAGDASPIISMLRPAR
jgi:hypothetical protein